LFVISSLYHHLLKQVEWLGEGNNIKKFKKWRDKYVPRLCYKIKKNAQTGITTACLNWGGNISQERYDEMHIDGKSVLAEIMDIALEWIVPIDEVEYDKQEVVDDYRVIENNA
jgi:D-mannonate dehydratase